jgi:UDP-2-acetamido-3-amino-2,3-dideoxy-glucuronate N-acetyltransferase
VTDYTAHPSACIDAGAVIGSGTRVWHFAHIMSGAKLGARCTIGQNVFVAGSAVIGDNVKIQNNVSVYDGVTIEEDVFCGPSMVFTNVSNPRSHVSRKHEYRPTVVRRGATLGANCTVICGHVVGRYAFVGAGAVVTRDIPDFALVVGVPARQVGWMCVCGQQLDIETSQARCECGACRRGYVRQADGLVLESET